MTVEKAIEILSGVGDFNRCCAEDAEALALAIQALERQQSDDCISRQEAISAIQDEYYAHAVGIDIVDIIAHLPPVQPTRPTGKWIVCDVVKFGDFVGTEKYECSKCHHRVGAFKSNFCPNCGARMEESEDSE